MKVLFINGCISTHQSRTLSLSKRYLSHYDNVETVDIKGLLPLTVKSLDYRNQCIAKGDYSDKIFDLAKQFKEADVIVLSAPYWDLSFPAIVKAYFEQIMVSGLTFDYQDNHPVGLCKANKLVYITTAGGYIGNYNFGYDYIKALALMLGIQQCQCIKAEGLDIEGNDVDQILKAVEISC